MQLRSLSLRRLEIPFHRPFRHHSAQRSQSAGIWATALSESGQRGFGEACPRPYVTGEDFESAEQCWQSWQPSLLAQIHDLPGLQHWQQTRQAEIDRHPAAWCALELALLDLLARETRQSVESLLGLGPVTGPFHYSAVLGIQSPGAFAQQLQQYQKLGLRDIKVKLSGNLAADQACLALLQDPQLRIRADLNNAFADLATARAYFQALQIPFWAIEEPLQPARRFGELAQLAADVHSRIILDESCCKLADLQRLPAGRHWIVNLRISKMGGLLRSLELAQAALAAGIPLILGAQVGETSLLTRAALSLAQWCLDQSHPDRNDPLLAQEGAFGTYLLREDVVAQPLMFGAGGQLQLPRLPAQGFGLTIQDWVGRDPQNSPRQSPLNLAHPLSGATR